VDNYGHAVARQAHVQLNSGSAICQSSLESGERIFRSQSRSAAMADY
jgi:hypothetical protein